MGLFAAFAGASGDDAARRLVPPARAGLESASEMNQPKSKSTPRRAMVLAAGMGTRMRPLTDTMPKPLVKVDGKPLIDHVLDRLAEAKVERAVVNVHHFAEQIIAHVAGRKRPEIVISDERGLLLDTGGGVVKALPELGLSLIHISEPTRRTP